jgi:hypothetical protein
MVGLCRYMGRGAPTNGIRYASSTWPVFARDRSGLFIHVSLLLIQSNLRRSQEKTDEVLIKYNAYEGIDNLAEAVEEAKKAAAAARSNNSKRRSSTSASAQDVARGKDAWRPELAPRTAVHAVTVPLLEAERLRLERDLAEVGSLALRY